MWDLLGVAIHISESNLDTLVTLWKIPNFMLSNKNFDNLILRIPQAVQIKTRQLKPTRTFHFDTVDVKTLRRKLHQSKPILNDSRE